MVEQNETSARFNRTIFIIGFIYSILETAHYGWNMTSQSDGEVVADGISAIIYAMAWL